MHENEIIWMGGGGCIPSSQWCIQDFPEGAHQPAKLLDLDLFGIIFTKNYMKMKKNGLRGGAHPSPKSTTALVDPPRGPNSFIFMQFSAKILQNNR